MSEGEYTKDHSRDEEVLNYEPFTSTEAMVKAVGYEETPDCDFASFKSMVEQGKDYNFLIKYYSNYIINPFTSNQAMTSLLKLNNVASLNRYLNARQQDIKEYKEGVKYTQDARVKHTTDDNIIYYVSLKQDNTALISDTTSWAVDCTYFDFKNWSCNSSQSNIKLTHKATMKFTTEYLHNGLQIIFVAKKKNTSALSSIEIDGVVVGLCDNYNNVIQPGAIQKDTIIEIVYSEEFGKFVYIQKSSSYSVGDVFAVTPSSSSEKYQLVTGSFPCDGRTLDKDVYQNLWNEIGIRNRNSSDTTTGICWTGAQDVYIDTEETMAIGNNYFFEPTPPRQKQIVSQKAYRLKLDNGETYEVDATDGQKYVNISDQEDAIFFHTNDIKVGTVAYDKKTLEVYKKITGRTVTILYFNNLEYSLDTTETSNRKFANGAITVWTYADNQDIKNGTLFYQGITDPREIYCNFDVEKVATSKITADGYTYNQDASDGKKWTWDGKVPASKEADPAYSTIYTETATPEVGSKCFSSAVNANEITNFYVKTINTDNSTDAASTYQNTEEEPLNDFAQLSTGTLFYADSDRPEIGDDLYTEQLPATTGNVEEVYNILITNDKLEAMPADEMKEYTIDGTIYYTIKDFPANNDWLYAEKYPTAQGQYTAFDKTGASITIDGTEYTADPDTQGRYIGSKGTLFYTRRLNAITQENAKMLSLPTSFVEYVYTDKYCTSGKEKAQIKSQTDDVLILTNGSELNRYKQGDVGTTFRLPNLQNGTLVGATNINELGTVGVGKLPNITGEFGAVHTGGKATGAFRKSSYIGNLRTASSRSGNYSFDASRCSSIYTSNFGQVQPAGLMVVYYIKA